jgi:lactoylglutathione lyase
MLKKTLPFFIFIMITGAVYAQKPYASFNHIGIYVSDVKKSAAFYIKLFHLDTIKTPFPGQPVIWLKIGNHSQIHLIQGKKEEIVIPPDNHIAFSVPSMFDFITFLQKENIYYEGDTGKAGTFVIRSDGVKQIYLKDPDGYWVEVNDAP